MLISPAMVLQKQMRLITFQKHVMVVPYKQIGKDTGAYIVYFCLFSTGKAPFMSFINLST